MRGLSFTAASRRTRASTDLKPAAPASPSAPSTSSTSSSSLRLFKKLSATLRRRDSTSRDAPPPPRMPSDDLSAHSARPPLPLPPAHPRALTFAAGEPAARTIPFFESPAPVATVAVVRGKPEWQQQRRELSASTPDHTGSPVSDAPSPSPSLSAPTSDDELPSEPALKTLPALPPPKPAPLREANVRLPPPLPREHALSFSAADRPRRPAAAARAKSVSVPEGKGKNPPRALAEKKKMSRRRNAQRWLLPLTENKDKPRVFTPPAGTAFERITARRDRTEARALVSACTYLEGEVLRMRALLAGDHGTGKCCCASSGKKKEADCSCAMRTFIEGGAERMKAVLKILEDRYDSIEQVYIKSEEYAVAMGRFFEVSPQVINKLAAGHHELANNAQRDGSKRKSLR